MPKKNIKSFIIPIIAIVVFTLLMFGAGYAYFVSTINMNTANYQVTLPKTTSLVCTKTDCGVTITPAMMASGAVSSTAKATNTCSVACTCTGTPGAVCTYNVALVESGMTYMSSAGIGSSKEFSVKVTSPSGCTAQNTSGTETQVNTMREKIVSSCSLTVPSGGSTSATVSAEFKWYNLNVDQSINANKIFKYQLKTEGVLPDTYQQVDFIQSSGTQWINTGVTIDSKNYQIYTDYQYTSVSSSNPTLVGCAPQTGGATRFYPMSPAGSAKARFTYGSQDFYIDSWAGTSRHADIFNDVNHRIYEDSVYVGTTNPSQLTVPNVSLGLFALNLNAGANYFASAKVYSLKIHDGTSLVRNFVPCYRKSDSAIGMYDIVNGSFYTNSGTGDFSKGNNV